MTAPHSAILFSTLPVILYQCRRDQSKKNSSSCRHYHKVKPEYGIPCCTISLYHQNQSSNNTTDKTCYYRPFCQKQFLSFCNGLHIAFIPFSNQRCHNPHLRFYVFRSQKTKPTQPHWWHGLQFFHSILRS